MGDGSCFSKVMPPVQAEGYAVVASQHGLDSHAGDVATVTSHARTRRQPAILVGYSYGGRLITAAGFDERVASTWYLGAANDKATPLVAVRSVHQYLALADEASKKRPSSLPGARRLRRDRVE